MLLDPTFPSLDFTVLFFISILRGYEFWFQTDDMFIFRLDNDRGQHTVKMVDLPILQDALATLLTIYLLGREVFCPIHRY